MHSDRNVVLTLLQLISQSVLAESAGTDHRLGIPGTPGILNTRDFRVLGPKPGFGWLGWRPASDRQIAKEEIHAIYMDDQHQ